MTKRDTGVCIVVGLVGMWITYAITKSVGWAWLAFFIVGYLAYSSSSQVH